MAFNESLRIKIIPAHLVGRHLAIGLDAVLEAVELPAGVADLTAGLPDVDADALTLKNVHSFRHRTI